MTRSVESLTSAVKQAGAEVISIDPGGGAGALLAALRAAWRRDAVAIYNVGTQRSLAQAVWAQRLIRHRSALFVHGRSLADELGQGLVARASSHFSAFDEIWVNNDLVAEQIRGVRGVGDRVVVVSPWVGTQGVDVHPRQVRNVAVGTYRGDPLYGVDLAIDAVDLARAGGHDVVLHVLMYGASTPESRALTCRLAGLSWVRLHRDLQPSQVEEVLRSCDLLLRPTTTDGDSMIVREALSLGLRVVASRCVPRPTGTELADLDAADLFRAMVDGGAPSDGGGLGMPANVMVFRLAGYR